MKPVIRLEHIEKVFHDGKDDFEALRDVSLDVEQGDMATGPWWLYESENNEACKAAGFCPAVDETPIQDQDQFTFKYTDSY